MPDWQHLIEQIHAAPWQAVIAVTGGGVSAVASLLAVPGGSNTLLEAVVPYSAAALAEFIGRQPEQFCSESTALAMSAVAYQRATRLAKAAGHATEQQVGVGCTAALVSLLPKRGEHRCFVAAHSATATASYALVLEKGARDRAGEEALAGHLLLCALARAAGLTDIPLLELRPGESVVQEIAVADPLLVELAQGRRNVVWSQVTAPPPQREWPAGFCPSTGDPLIHCLAAVPPETPRGLLCGAFAPLHVGHRRLREVAEQRLGGQVGYELSIQNVDKPPLDYLTIERRRLQLDDGPLALTNAPTFAAKARILPGLTFVIGVDTAERIVQPRYYNDSLDEMHAALEEVRRQGCHFLTAGRLVGERFVTLEEVAIPAEFADLFTSIPASEFRVDASSTALRTESAEG